MKFSELKIEKSILKALREAGYEEPTPIQQKAIPPLLDGHDLMGCAQTGTGKTCAFSVPIIQHIASEKGKPGTVRALILTPPRELALQIFENVCAVYLLYGGGYFRRCFAGAAGRGDCARRGYSDCYARPPVGFDGAGGRQAWQGRVFCAG